MAMERGERADAQLQFMMGYALDSLARGGQLPIGPATKAYIAKMKARPAFVRGMARATAAAGEVVKARKAAKL